MTKEFLKERGIEYTDYNVGTDTAKRQEMLEKSGQLGVPVIVIDSKDLIVGFDQKALTKLLEIPA